MVLNPKILHILQANVIRKKILSQNRNNAATILMKFCKRLNLYLPNYKYTSVKREPQPVTITHHSPNHNDEVNINGSNLKIQDQDGGSPTAADPSTSRKPFNIKCEVMARIPTVLYRYKDIHLQIRREKEMLVGRPISSSWIRRKTTIKTKKKKKVDENELILVPTSNLMEYEMIPRKLLTPEQIKKYEEETESYTKKRAVHLRMKKAMEEQPSSNYALIPNSFQEPVPSKNRKEMFLFGYGESQVSRVVARNLAALEIIYQLEQIFDIERGAFREYSIANVKKLAKVTASYQVLPYHRFFPCITWENKPIDRSFVLHNDTKREILHRKKPMQRRMPSTETVVTLPRDGNIDFLPQIRNDPSTLIVAKIITLSSVQCLPIVDIIRTKKITEHGNIFANIQPMGGPFINIIKSRPDGVRNIGLDNIHAQIMALTYWYDTMKYENPTYKLIKQRKKERCLKMIDSMAKIINSSYGMAKIFIALPLHHFDDLETLVKSITPQYNFPKVYRDMVNGNNSYSRQKPIPEFSISQLVLHAIATNHPITGEQLLHLMANAPDTPPQYKIRQNIRDLISQGLVRMVENDASSIPLNDDSEEIISDLKLTPEEHYIEVAPLGYAINEFPVEPRIARILFMGLVLRAMHPSLTIAALLSVPNVFRSRSTTDFKDTKMCSDVAYQMEAYNSYINGQRDHPSASIFDQVTKTRSKFRRIMKHYLVTCSERREQVDDQPVAIDWNINSTRTVAHAALICAATNHVAHLVDGTNDEFATRNIAGTCKIHPSSVNSSPTKRVHWYVYNDLRYAGNVPYLHNTTAVSPLEIALFCDADLFGPIGKPHRNACRYEKIRKILYDENWLFHVDQWIPVAASIPKQIEVILRLRQILIYDMLQRVALDPITFAENEKYFHLVQYILSALEQQRFLPELEKVGLPTKPKNMMKREKNTSRRKTV